MDGGRYNRLDLFGDLAHMQQLSHCHTFNKRHCIIEIKRDSGNNNCTKYKTGSCTRSFTCFFLVFFIFFIIQLYLSMYKYKIFKTVFSSFSSDLMVKWRKKSVQNHQRTQTRNQHQRNSNKNNNNKSA